MKTKKPIWCIEESEFPSGDLYELVLKTIYAVYHKDMDEPIYVFERVEEADYNGTGWTQTSESGVKSIRIMTDKKRLLVNYCNGESFKYPLREPYVNQVLTADETQQLMPFFLAYQQKSNHYEYAEDSIIRETKQAMNKAFEHLEHQLFVMGLNRYQAKITLPQRASKKRGYTKENLKDLELFLAEI